MNATAVKFSSDCRHTHICPRCYYRDLQISRGDVWVGLYLIYYFSGASGWQFWWVSNSGQSWSHVEGPPFVNYLSYSGWMELESFGLIALPRLMSCHYPLLHVLGYLLCSRHCWFIWDHSGLVGFLSLLISAGRTLSQGCLISLVCLNDLFNVFHLRLLPAWFNQRSWGFTYFCTYTNSMFHVVFGAT